MSDAKAPSTSIERLSRIEEVDLQDLCTATEEAIRDGNGFGWLEPPRRSACWKHTGRVSC